MRHAYYEVLSCPATHANKDEERMVGSSLHEAKSPPVTFPWGTVDVPPTAAPPWVCPTPSWGASPAPPPGAVAVLILSMAWKEISAARLRDWQISSAPTSVSKTWQVYVQRPALSDGRDSVMNASNLCWVRKQDQRIKHLLKTDVCDEQGCGTETNNFHALFSLMRIEQIQLPREQVEQGVSKATVQNVKLCACRWTRLSAFAELAYGYGNGEQHGTTRLCTADLFSVNANL